jgi:D-alanyl-D-alanine carboxypeptidase (penicillin-binding protein 5/6)
MTMAVLMPTEALAQSAPTTVAAPAATSAPDPLDAVVGRAWLLMDAANGKVLASHSAHEPQLSASTVKVVTALTAVRKLGWNAKIKVTQNAANRPPMKIGMNAGEVWPIRDALASMLLVSANDAAYAVAEAASGSLEAFAKDMAVTAKALGMKDSTFGDPAGFDGADTKVGESRVSAYDLALAGQALLAEPTLAKMVRSRVISFTGPDGTPHKLINHNRALDTTKQKFYDGTIGIKTGFTRAAQGTFVTAATRGGRTLIAVVLGNKDIYTPTQSLFDVGFNTKATAATEPAVTDPVDPEQALAAPPPSAETATTVVAQSPEVVTPVVPADDPALLATTTLPQATVLPTLPITVPATVEAAVTGGAAEPASASNTGSGAGASALLGLVGVSALVIAGLGLLRWVSHVRPRQERRERALSKLSSLGS